MGAGFQWGYARVLTSIDDDGAGPRPNAVYASALAYDGGYVLHVSRWDGHIWEELADESIETNSGVRSLVAMPTSGDWTLPPSIWGLGSITVDNNPYRQPAVRLDSPSPFFHAWSKSQLVTLGGAVALRVAAGGAEPLAYQWRRNGQSLVDGGTINGATTSELVITGFSHQDAGQYDCVVTNACGSEISPPAKIDFCVDSATPDINGDGAVNGRDIQVFVSNYLAASQSVLSICHVDLNGNHSADAYDAYLLVRALLAG